MKVVFNLTWVSAYVDIKDFNIQKVTQLMNAIITVLKLFNGRCEKCISEVRLRLTQQDLPHILDVIKCNNVGPY